MVTDEQDGLLRQKRMNGKSLGAAEASRFEAPCTDKDLENCSVSVAHNAFSLRIAPELPSAGYRHRPVWVSCRVLEALNELHLCRVRNVDGQSFDSRNAAEVFEEGRER